MPTDREFYAKNVKANLVESSGSGRSVTFEILYSGLSLTVYDELGYVVTDVETIPADVRMFATNILAALDGLTDD
jgi:hypothetical protein